VADWTEKTKIRKMSEIIRVPPGLYGVAVAETRISKSGADGSLTYRGYDIKELFDKASFEESAFLVLEGQLPNRRELDEFVSKLRSRVSVPDAVYQMVRSMPRDSHPMDVLRTAVSGLGTLERSLPPKEQQCSLIAKMPTLVANCYRIVRGMEPVAPDPSLGQAANLLYMLSGERPDDFDAWVFERELILYLEHDLNVSTFTVRVVASALADIYSASTAGLAALKGPLHGGANEAAMQMLLEIGSPDRAGDYLSERLAQGKKVMGFGHRVYKKVDPRAQLSKGLLKRLLEHRHMDEGLYRLSDAAERFMLENKKIPANLDFYAAPIFYTLSIPTEVYTPIFAASRIVGWASHYNEQLADNKLFRPDSVYVGPSGLTYVPIENR
jgi:citrate synthase